MPQIRTAWWRGAVVYQIYPRSFADGDRDGVGDLAGIRDRLDHLVDLGADAIWLSPIYRSPMTDFGYDVSDHCAVDPVFGDLDTFDRLLADCHARGLRMLLDWVPNHTSDEHPWFVESRSSRSSPRRDWYVWSDTDQSYADARVIFTDAETSNWTWDQESQQYYWHRFFSHQPDLNYDNPQVVRAVLRVMRFWLDLGVDGLRLDAVPYLVEREGTSCENLPETHA